MFEVQKTSFELQKTLFKLHETLPTLYGKDTSGKAKQWSAAILLNGSVARYTVEYGQVDGKLQTTSRDFTEGKNIGKKNETTPLQQCTNEIKKKWEDKKEKERYSENEESDEVGKKKNRILLKQRFSRCWRTSTTPNPRPR